MEKNSLQSKTNSFAEENQLDWNLIQKNFEATFGNQIYSSWLKNISLIKEYNHYVILGVETRFFRDWITSRYADKILSVIKKHKLSINRIEFKIESERLENRATTSDQQKNKIFEIKDSILNYSKLNPNLNFENFVVGKSNKIGFLSAKKNMH